MPLPNCKNAFILSCFYLLCSFASYAQTSSNTPEIITNYSYPEDSTDFESFLNDELGIPSDVLERQGYLKKIKSWNPHLKNSNSLRSGEQVYIELPYGTPIQNRRPSQRKLHISQPVLAEKTPPPSRSQSSLPPSTSSIDRELFHLRALYMVSTGVYGQEILNSDVSANTQQNSPITLGIMGSYQMLDSLKFQSHATFAKFNGVSSEVEVESSIPWQYELGLFASYTHDLWPLAPIVGLELEKLATFNILELSSGSTQVLQTQEDQLLFATLGGEFHTSLFDLPIDIVPSVSRIMNSSNFSGSRFQVQLQARSNPSSSWSYHLLVRHYLMSTPEQELKLTRFGAGVSFQFF